MTLGNELRALDAMNRLGLSMTYKTIGCEFRDLGVMNNIGLCMT